jgi:hypothetical protein
MWKGWKFSGSQEFFPHIIREVKEIQEDPRKYGKSNFNFIRI